MRNIACFFKQLWRRIPLKKRPYMVAYIEEPLPLKLKNSVIYAVLEDGIPWYACLRCPCGCGATVFLSLLTEDYPSWRLSENTDGTVTLYPSVWRTTGCRSHFSIRRGHILWHRAGDSDRTP